MYRILIALIIISTSCLAQEQPAEVLWCWNTYGFSLTRMAVDSKGCAVLSGGHMVEERDWNILVRKLAADKDSVIWSGNYGIPGRAEHAEEIRVDKRNNIYMLCSHNPGQWDPYSAHTWSLLKVSPLGESLWEFDLTESMLTRAEELAILSNGDILIIGNLSVSDGYSVERMPTAVCVRQNGKLRWSKTFDALPSNIAFSTIVVSEEGRILISSESSSSSDQTKPRVIELSRKGKLLHMRELAALENTPDGELLPQVLAASGDTLFVYDETDRQITKLSLDGSHWFENLPLDSNRSSATAAHLTHDNLFVFDAGYPAGNRLTSFSRGTQASLPSGVLFTEAQSTLGGFGFLPQIEIQNSRIYMMTQTAGQSGCHTHVYCLKAPKP